MEEAPPAPWRAGVFLSVPSSVQVSSEEEPKGVNSARCSYCAIFLTYSGSSFDGFSDLLSRPRGGTQRPSRERTEGGEQQGKLRQAGSRVLPAQPCGSGEQQQEQTFTFFSGQKPQNHKCSQGRCGVCGS